MPILCKVFVVGDDEDVEAGENLAMVVLRLDPGGLPRARGRRIREQTSVNVKLVFVVLQLLNILHQQHTESRRKEIRSLALKSLKN